MLKAVAIPLSSSSGEQPRMRSRAPSSLRSEPLRGLPEDDERQKVTLRAIKSVIALQLHQGDEGPKLTFSVMAAEMAASRAKLNRALDADAANMMLDKLSRAAKLLGRGLKIDSDQL